MNCNTTHYRANSSSVPGDPTVLTPGVIVHSAIRPGAAALHAWMRPWARLVLASAGVRVRVETRAALDPAQPVVFVSNHQNALDILTTAAAIRHPFGFAAKSELRRMPFIGWVLARTASVFVDRSTPRRTAETMILAGRQIREGHAVLLFAEGSRTYSRALGSFLRGAFMLAVEAGVPLVPVTVVDNVRVLDERVAASRPGVVRVVVGAPIPTAGLGRGAVPELVEQVCAVMQAELDRYAGPDAPRTAGALAGKGSAPAVSSGAL